jgi:hypothetical protein
MVAELPAQMEAAEPASAMGLLLMVTFLLLEHRQPLALVTVTLMVAVPACPEVQVMERVP